MITDISQLKAIEARFWKKVDIKGPDECWLWNASIRINGFGQIWVNQKLETSNRVAFALTRGFLPKHVGMTCKNRRCCNSAHLFEKNGGRGILTPPQIQYIVSTGKTSASLATKFGVDVKIIYRVRAKARKAS